MLSRNRIEQLRKQCPKDTLIELLNMNGESQMHSGLKGTVLAVDDIGQIHVAWGNGSRLALNIEEDQFIAVNRQEEKNETELEEEDQRVDIHMGMYGQ